MEEWDKLYKDACESGVSEDKASMLKSYLCGLIEEEREEFEKGDAEVTWSGLEKVPPTASRRPTLLSAAAPRPERLSRVP